MAQERPTLLYTKRGVWLRRIPALCRALRVILGSTIIVSVIQHFVRPFHIIGRWKNIILNDLDENFFYNSINTIKTISAAELQALSQKYLNPADFYELVVV